MMPKRHAVDRSHLDALMPIADIGEPESIQRRGWMVLLQVHGYPAVLRAVACCYKRLGSDGLSRLVLNEHAHAVLDGERPPRVAVEH